MNLVPQYIFLVLLFVLSGCKKDHAVAPAAILPQPVHLQQQAGEFLFSGKSVWLVENDQQAMLVTRFSESFGRVAGFTPEISRQQGNLILKTDGSIAEEGYKLQVTAEKIEITAATNTGFFYGLQSLRQLLPAEFDGAGLQKEVRWSIPCVTVEDSPRFAYRGLMLDVSRYFIPKDRVCKIIDAAAMMKINKLHMHLVDDNGWRLEIKKYPKLTEVGAWRVERDDFFPARALQRKGEPATQGGFYTQQEMREMIAYAAERQIEVIPEIEMPAHTNSSLAAYPELACPVVKGDITVLAGIGGRNAEIIYCAGNEKVFHFLQDIIDEVVDLFPSQYIHLGGDEASKTYWEKCPKCQARMKKEGIPNEEELQSYFMKRMCRYVQQKGKKPMGWDELTNSELPADVIIYGWQGMGNAALKAARQGHEFIMTPARKMYLIRYQGPQWFEPRTYFGNNTLEDVYSYEPIQKEWEPEIIPLLKGVQASLWTEFCTSSEDVEYLIFPRLAALAEVAWSPVQAKNWSGFLGRLDRISESWAQMGITYARSMFNLDHQVEGNGNSLAASISCIRPDVEIRYTEDGSEPTAQSALYGETLMIQETKTIRAATFRNGERMGEILTLPLSWNKAIGKKVTSTPQADRLYVLTNGLRGSDKHSDFEWSGWYNTDFSVTVDLEKEEPISAVTLGTVTNYGMAVHMPASIEVLGSNDNETFFPIARKDNRPEDIFRKGIFVEDHRMQELQAKARYVKVIARNHGTCPADHVRPDQKIWIYFDEIIIE
ncbi:MAG: glycoside hydrolase family 20 protein [Bacteroidales bacterium]